MPTTGSCNGTRAGRTHGAEITASGDPGSRAGTSLTGEFAGLAETPYARAGCTAPRTHRPVLSGRGDYRGVRGGGLSPGAPDIGHRRARPPLRDGPTCGGKSPLGGGQRDFGVGSCTRRAPTVFSAH